MNYNILMNIYQNMNTRNVDNYQNMDIYKNIEHNLNMNNFPEYNKTVEF